MTAVLLEEDDDGGLTWVGRPMELLRVLDLPYLDQAIASFDRYVQETLAASQAAGGRFNPPGEFGALYTASDEETAWAEIAARYRRQGLPGLPPDMGLLRIVVLVGRFADLSDGEVRARWEVDADALIAEEPTSAQRDHCWMIGRSVRAVADFLRAPSARGDGHNVPLFPDRTARELRMELQAAEERRIPEHLAQRPREEW